MGNMILYSTGCMNCKILKKMLDDRNIKYDICSDIQIMIDKNFKSVPMLEIHGEIMNYSESIKRIKGIKI